MYSEHFSPNVFRPLLARVRTLPATHTHARRSRKRGHVECIAQIAALGTLCGEHGSEQDRRRSASDSERKCAVTASLPPLSAAEVLFSLGRIGGKSTPIRFFPLTRARTRVPPIGLETRGESETAAAEPADQRRQEKRGDDFCFFPILFVRSLHPCVYEIYWMRLDIESTEDDSDDRRRWRVRSTCTRVRRRASVCAWRAGGCVRPCGPVLVCGVCSVYARTESAVESECRFSVLRDYTRSVGVYFSLSVTSFLALV